MNVIDALYCDDCGEGLLMGQCLDDVADRVCAIEIKSKPGNPCSVCGMHRQSAMDCNLLINTVLGEDIAKRMSPQDWREILKHHDQFH